MKITLITPWFKHRRSGNAITAQRYARILRSLGHRVDPGHDYTGASCDLMIALHARRSFDSMYRFRQLHGDLPLILVLTGTDLYRDIRRSSRARKALRMADRLVITSRIEGNSNVLCAALALGTPLIASRIAGNLGTLEADYPGYFPVGDTRRLAELLSRCESDACFYRTLQSRCARMACQVDPARELKSWKRLLDHFAATTGTPCAPPDKACAAALRERLL
jgi:glycosyltransferase involved in cell wall biosynthesis